MFLPEASVPSSCPIRAALQHGCAVRAAGIFLQGKAVPLPEATRLPVPPQQRGRHQILSNTPWSNAAFRPFPDARPGLIMLQGNMESTPFCAGAAPFLDGYRRTGQELGCATRKAHGARIAPDAANAFCECAYQVPVLAMLAHGSCGGRCPSCRSSTEMPSGDFTNAMWPSRGGRWTMCPASTMRWHVS